MLVEDGESLMLCTDGKVGRTCMTEDVSNEPVSLDKMLPGTNVKRVDLMSSS